MVALSNSSTRELGMGRGVRFGILTDVPSVAAGRPGRIARRLGPRMESSKPAFHQGRSGRRRLPANVHVCAAMSKQGPQKRLKPRCRA